VAEGLNGNRSLSEEGVRYYFEDLSVGMEDSFSKIVTAADIESFADLSGDNNPIHLDEEFASASVFGERIAHGLLSASFISTVIGTRLPGPGAIYMSQSLKFLAPVRVGDAVTARARITSLNEEKKRAVLACTCMVDGEAVIDGEAIVMIPAREA